MSADRVPQPDETWAADRTGTVVVIVEVTGDGDVWFRYRRSGNDGALPLGTFLSRYSIHTGDRAVAS